MTSRGAEHPAIPGRAFGTSASGPARGATGCGDSTAPGRPDAGWSRTVWLWARPLGGVAILAALVWRLGTVPFLDGIRVIDGGALAAAAGIAGLTTMCCAWRWSLVARGLGIGVPLRTAVAAYYRSQFLNASLPGGVLGDVERAVRHGRDVGDVGRGLRAVAWERAAGQMVQIMLAAIVLFLLPSPARSAMPVVAAAVAAGGLCAVIVGRALPRGGPSRWARTLRAAATDLREGVLRQRMWPGIVLASAVVVAGHAATFLIAARTSGSTASPVRMLPLAMLVLLAMGVPTNIGGWGPREGVAAWVFGLAGQTAAQGVTTAVVYGVMVLVASLPGAGVLIAGGPDRGTRRRQRTQPHARRPDVAARPEGSARG